MTIAKANKNIWKPKHNLKTNKLTNKVNLKSEGLGRMVIKLK